MTSLSLYLQHLPSARLSVVARRPRFALLIDLPVPACAAVDESSSAGGGGRRAPGRGGDGTECIRYDRRRRRQRPWKCRSRRRRLAGVASPGPSVRPSVRPSTRFYSGLRRRRRAGSPRGSSSLDCRRRRRREDPLQSRIILCCGIRPIDAFHRATATNAENSKRGPQRTAKRAVRE